MPLLQEGRVLTARQIADALEVSPRTVYRDIGDLVGSGIPIDGEAGVGYLLRDGYRLPPLMFTREELVALGLGAQMVRAWSDRALGEVTASAIRKIESVLPPSLKDEIRESPLQVPRFMASEQLRDNLEVLRRCVDEKRKVVARYVSLQQAETTRTLRPLLLYFWGSKWTLGAWCELREDFRLFRVDLLGDICPDKECLDPAPGRDASAYMAQQAWRFGGH